MWLDFPSGFICNILFEECKYLFSGFTHQLTQRVGKNDKNYLNLEWSVKRWRCARTVCIQFILLAVSRSLYVSLSLNTDETFIKTRKIPGYWKYFVCTCVNRNWNIIDICWNINTFLLALLRNYTRMQLFLRKFKRESRRQEKRKPSSRFFW